MTTENQQSGEQNDQAVVPSPKDTAPESQSKPLGDVVTTEAFHELTQQVRGLQGSIKKTSDKVSDNSEILTRYQDKIDSGMKPAQAEKAIAAEDKAGKDAGRLQRIEETLASLVGGKLVGNEVNTPSEATRLINELELDGNAPEVTSVLAKGLKGLELENAMLRLNRPKMSASTPPPKTPQPARALEGADLVKPYVEELKAAGTSRAVAAQVRAKYEKLGLTTGAVIIR